MSPLNSTCTLRPPTSRVIFAGNDSVPVIAPTAAALATACSISRCELMPTDFRNLRMLKFSASSFIGISQFIGSVEFDITLYQADLVHLSFCANVKTSIREREIGIPPMSVDANRPSDRFSPMIRVLLVEYNYAASDSKRVPGTATRSMLDQMAMGTEGTATCVISNLDC